MDEQNNVYVRTCCRCKREYESTAKKSYVCPDCKKENKRQLDSFKNNDYHRPKRVTPAEYCGLFSRVNEVDRYNAENGTNLSYGKYELLKFLKKI